MSEYLQTCAFSHPQTTHPHVIEKCLATCMGYKLAVVGSHTETEACLITEILQFISKQLLGVVIINLITVFQQF